MRKNQRQHLAVTSHFRQWKSGKTWLYTAGMTVALAAGTAVGQTVASADALLSPDTTIVQSSGNSSSSSAAEVLVSPIQTVNSSSALASNTTIGSTSVTSVVSQSQPASSSILSSNATQIASSAVSLDSQANSVVVLSNVTTTVKTTSGSVGILPTVAPTQLSSSFDTISNIANQTALSAASSSNQLLVTSDVATQLSNASVAAIVLAASAPAISAASSIMDITVGDAISAAVNMVGLSGLTQIVNTLGSYIPGLAGAATVLNTVSLAVSEVGVAQSTVSSLQDMASSGIASLNGLISGAVDAANTVGLGSMLAGLLSPVTSAISTASTIVGTSPADAWNALTTMPAVTTPAIGLPVSGLENLIPSLTLIPSGQDITSGIVGTIANTLGIPAGNVDMPKLLSLQGEALANYIATLAIESAVNNVGKMVAPTVDSFLNSVPLVGSAVANAVNPLLNDIVSISPNALLNAAVSVVKSLFSPILSAIQPIVDSLTNAINGIIGVSIKTKDLTLTVGDNWTPEMNFVSARDGVTGLNISQLTVSGLANTGVAGSYKVTYSFSDSSTGRSATSTATITVNPKALLSGASLSTPKAVTLATSPAVSPMNPSVANPTVSSQLTNSAAPAQTVTVNPAQKMAQAPTINVVSGAVAIYSTQTFKDSLILISTTDSEGNPVPNSNVTRTITTSTGAVANLALSGSYTVTYSYTDPVSGLTGTSTGTLIVRQDKANTGW